MIITRRNQDLMPTLFNELMNNWFATPAENNVTPKMNVSESENDYRVEICTPGMKKDDLNICIDHENNLVVEMSKKEENENKETRNYLRHEFKQMQFKQMFSLPENVKKEDISAKAEDGILTIILPKFTPEEKKQLTQTITIS